MTLDEILKMAEDADAYSDAMDVGGKATPTLRDEHFAALVAAHEREACAKVCLEEAPSLDGQLCAEAIRARGQG